MSAGIGKALKNIMRKDAGINASLMFRMEHYLFENFEKKPTAKLEAQDILAVVRPLEQVGKMKYATHYFVWHL